MPMSISEIYAYVFGDKARRPTLPEGIKLEPQQQAKKAERAAAAEAAKKAEFDFIIGKPGLSREFRNLLREEKNTDLECLLYGNTSDVLQKTKQPLKYEMPTPDVMRAQFETLNREYGYFTDTSVNIFIQLVKASKLIADFVEENNSDDNAVAYLHAYKMMVLFKINEKSPWNGITDYINKHFADKPKAIHDALVLAIPNNIPPLKHLAEWQKFIMQYGNKALSLFQQAQVIEPYLKGPMTLIAVQHAASQIQYKKYEVNPELALLCAQYHVSEKDFDKCLAIKPKQSDQLPEVMVDGASLGHPGYCLVKLPIDDPRAFILGHITNCCQSIGGASEQCVIDGITREQNGFYVLLKTKSKAPGNALIAGKINYDQYDIVGQGYAWLSQLDNLTFDSWENLTPNVDDAVIVDMLGAFASQCFEKKPTIGRITIGQGGKTPAAYSAATPYPEKIAEGIPYRDSTQQATVAMNPALLEETARTNEKLDKLLGNDVDVALSFELFFMKQIEWLESLLTKTALQGYKTTIGEVAYQALLQKALRNPGYLEIIGVLHQSKLLTRNTSKLVLNLSVNYEHGVAQALSTLYKANPALVNDKNFKLLAQNAQYANNMGSVLSFLYGANPVLVNDENFKWLAQNMQYANNMQYAINMGRALSTLYQANPALVNDENRKWMAQAAQYAHATASALSFLYRANPVLVNDENRKWLAQNMQYADCMGRALSTLYQANPALVNDENRKWLAQNALYADHMARALSFLYRDNPVLVNYENRKWLAQNVKDADNMAGALSFLYRANPVLVNDENRKWLAQNAHVASALSTLYKANLALVNNENFNWLAQNAQYAEDMANALSTLYKANPALVNDKNFKWLAQSERYCAEGMANGLVTLYEANPVLFNDENFKFLAQNALYAHRIAVALHTLYSANPALVNDKIFKFLAQNARDAKYMASALTTLYHANPVLVNDENFKFLAQKARYAEDMASALTTLYRANPVLVNDENFKLLANVTYVAYMASALTTLYRANPALVNDENFKWLAQNTQYADRMSNGLSFLYQANPALVNDINFKWLAQNAQYAVDMANALSFLYKANPVLVNDENRNWLAQNMHAECMDRALSALYRANPASITNEFFKKLIGDYLPQTLPSVGGQSSQLGLFSSRPDEPKKAADETLKKDAEGGTCNNK